jgi:hypothetical protein
LSLEDWHIAQDHINEIEKARTTLVRIRRDCMTKIATGSLGQGTMDAVEALVLVDEAIEAAEKAKLDEERLAGKVKSRKLPSSA